MMPRPAGLEARERLEAFQAARREVARAEMLLNGALAVASTAPASPTLDAGVELARRRLSKSAARLEAAVNVLAESRPPYEAFWSLPDDI